MGDEITVESVKTKIIDGAKMYFEQTGEPLVEGFLPLFVDSLFDEYRAARNYPDYFTAEQIDADVVQYFSRKSMYIAMIAIPTIYGKIGAEGQISHSENGISRTWEDDGWFADVVPYCEVL